MGVETTPLPGQEGTFCH